MTHRIRSKRLGAWMAVFAAVATPAAASEVVFSYSNPEDAVGYVGTAKAELYDVAILLNDPGLRGAMIVGVEIPVHDTEDISGYSAWISTELVLEANDAGKKVNAPDVCSVEAVRSGETLTARFAEPYRLTGDPVYVGYSFNVSSVGKEDSDIRKFPVSVTAQPAEGSLMMHTQRHYLKWADRTEDLGAKSAMRVILDGNFPEVSLSLEAVRDIKLQGDVEKLSLPVYIKSYGGAPIESLEFSCRYQGKTKKSIVNFDEPITPLFGQSTLVNLELDNDFDLATETIEITLDKANGVENPTNANTADFKLSLLKLMPKKRPVVEEYTGLWCGFCPRGYVGMETMSAEQPDFIGIAFHNDDPMAITSSYPNPVAGFPSCYIDRVLAKSPSATVLRKYWNERAVDFTPVEISVSATRSKTNPSDIEVTSSYSFVEAPENPCRVSYILLANGLTDPDWAQKNYFSTQPESGLDMFNGQPADYYGLTFNDVAAMYSPYAGEAGSVPEPEEIVAYQRMDHSYLFRTAGQTSVQGYDLIGAAGDNLTVVALMTDTVTGEVLNAAKSKLGESGVEDQQAAARRVVKTEYYDMTGAKVLQPAHGLYVKRVFFEDGAVEACKVIVR